MIERFIAAILFVVVVAAARAADPEGGTFLVRHNGYALLGPDGQEQERLESKSGAAGALSPDGRWVAFARWDANASQGAMVVQSRVRGQEPITVSLMWGTSGSSFLPIWSADSQRILICEQGYNKDRSRASAYCVFHLATKTLDEVIVPKGYWPNDWSADDRRLLTNAQPDDDTARLAWVNLDGTGAPEYITSEDEVAYSARLSPDGKRILCMAGPKAPNGKQSQARLCVIDLSTKKRVVVDEPGATHGYCWSADGSKIAYTWQRPLERPAEVAVRETFLVTCDADGSNRKLVTSRKYEVPPTSSGREGVIYFFEVLDWR